MWGAFFIPRILSGFGIGVTLAALIPSLVCWTALLIRCKRRIVPVIRAIENIMPGKPPFSPPQSKEYNNYFDARY
ncbi:MAG: hypothetical protein LBQ14_06570 [Treponema sp.]|jgi:hypothetical protein|nr:hypothetical protein [Treponema sp.]